MQESSGGRRTTLLIVVSTCIYVAVFVSWIAFKWGPPADRAVIGDVAFLPMSSTAALLSWRAAKTHTSARHRQAWRLFAGAYASYWAGDLCWFYFDVVRGTRPFPSVADIFYLAFYPLLVVGLVRLPRARRKRTERLTLSLDTATVTLGSLLVVWYLVIAPTVNADRGAPWLTRILDVTYPVGDAAVLFALAVVVLAGDRERDVSLKLLAAGLAVFVLADVIYARQSLDGSYGDGSWVNALWMLGQGATIVSARLVSGRGDDVALPVTIERRSRTPRLPYLAIAVALGLLLTVSVRNLSLGFVELVVGVVVLTGLVVGRQLTALHENRSLMTELRHVAEIDALTGLANRRHFFAVAEIAVRYAHMTDGSLGVLMIDIDHFKAINDSLGHTGGDAVLAQIATRCGTVLRPGDVLGRYGGDELVALIPNATPTTLRDVARRLNFVVAGLPVEVGVHARTVTLSIGAADSEHPTTLDQLIADADKALYQAKETGRDRCELHATRS